MNFFLRWYSGFFSRSAVLAAAALAMGSSACVQQTEPKLPALDAPYQAVLLDNGAVYFGKLENFNSATPILREVYYVQNALDQTSKQMRPILVRRGKELHAPDHMVLVREHIIFVEPVTKESQITRLIEDLRSK